MWYSYMKGERPLWERMMEFWKENTAQGPVEHAINQFIVDSMRLVNAGMLPTFQISPSSPVMQTMTEFMTVGPAQGLLGFPRADRDPYRLRRDRRPGGRAPGGPC